MDCEMTGLDLGRDALIEVAALVTDPDLNRLRDGVDVVIHAADDLLDGMFDVVREMHDRSGLTEQVRASAITVEESRTGSCPTSPATYPNRARRRCAATRSPPTGASSSGTCRDST